MVATRDLDHPKASPCTFPTSINDAGWVVGVWQDTSQDNQFCGNPNNAQHCVLWKPPDYSPTSFDNFGDAANCGAVNGLYSGPFVNGLGQFAGAAAAGQMIDVSHGVGSIFLDDTQGSLPNIQDANAAITVPATATDSFAAAGLNNNGQISGTTETGAWYNSDPNAPKWLPDSYGNLFVDADGTTFPILYDENCGSFVSINDEVQIMYYWGCVTALQQ